MTIFMERIDFSQPQQAAVLVDLLDAYAQDPMGGGVGLAAEVKACLAERLAAVPGAVGLVARLDGSPAGVATAFPGFSTFAARPLLSIHDLAVLAPFRRQGIDLGQWANIMQQDDKHKASVGERCLGHWTPVPGWDQAWCRPFALGRFGGAQRRAAGWAEPRTSRQEKGFGLVSAGYFCSMESINRRVSNDYFHGAD